MKSVELEGWQGETILFLKYRTSSVALYKEQRMMHEKYNKPWWQTQMAHQLHPVVKLAGWTWFIESSALWFCLTARPT